MDTKKAHSIVFEMKHFYNPSNDEYFGPNEQVKFACNVYEQLLVTYKNLQDQIRFSMEHLNNIIEQIERTHKANIETLEQNIFIAESQLDIVKTKISELEFDFTKVQQFNDSN